MKKSILLYLFILALLFNVFTYAYYSKKSDFDQKESEKGFKHLKDSLTLVTSKLDDANYFSLETNQNAQEYFENENIAYDKLMPQVKEALIAFNDDPKGNKYVGFEKMGEQKFVINKVKILNHRWIIADFSNGKLWGEVILKYFVNTNGTIDFETAETLIYNNKVAE
ncbi:MAG: hypothetical protein PSV16_07560 [Flavobacterium sp.]|nr:hypothetical protein [Flavobacterium sp.]